MLWTRHWKIRVRRLQKSRVALSDAAIRQSSVRLSVCLFVCSMPIAEHWCILGLWLLQNANRNAMLEVEPTG